MKTRVDVIADAFPMLPVFATQIFLLLFCTCYLGHLTACAWFAIGYYEFCEPEDSDEDITDEDTTGNDSTTDPVDAEDGSGTIVD